MSTARTRIGEFHTGQAVVFVDDIGPRGGFGDEIWPVKGRVYHIRELHYFQRTAGGSLSWCLLEEIVGPRRHYFNRATNDDLGESEAPWCLSRFRPATTAEAGREATAFA